MTKQLKWPGISISESDREIVTRIRQHDGYLKVMDMKDLLMLSAALAVNKELPPLSTSVANEKQDKQVTHPTLINQRDYEDFRQYIALIYYLTKGDRKIETLNDANAMIKNFVDYAERGLRYLEVNYINTKSGSDDLMDELIQLLKQTKE